MQPEVVGEVRRAAVDRPVGEIADASASTSLDMRVGRVACELDIDEKAVSAEETNPCPVHQRLPRLSMPFGCIVDPMPRSGASLVGVGSLLTKAI